MREHPENTLHVPPSTDGFMFCLWDAIMDAYNAKADSEIDMTFVTEQYKRVRAGLEPCPLEKTCSIRAQHLTRIAWREQSSLWAALTKPQRKRIKTNAQDALMSAERTLGPDTLTACVSDWLDSNIGALLGVKARRLLDSLEPQGPPEQLSFL